MPVVKWGGAQLLPLCAEFLGLEDPALPLSHRDLSQRIPFFGSSTKQEQLH